jgi:hypothetical protein
MQSSNELQQPFISLLIPPPINVIVLPNTFVRLKSNTAEGEGDRVGLVLSVNIEQRMLKIRNFLSWQEVVGRIGTNNLPANVSFWPVRQQPYPPHYLCDTDEVVSVPTTDVLGLAFVFHASDKVVDELHGVAHTYQVSSCVWFTHGIIQHQKTFESFPSSQFTNLVFSCFPSTVFYQMLGLKNAVHRLLNTRTLNARNTVKAIINNFDRHTWDYLAKVALVGEVAKSTVTRYSFLERDQLVANSMREEQRVIWLGYPEHLPIAQKIFGSTAGVGVRFVARISLPRNEVHARNHRAIAESDQLNIIPFERNLMDEMAPRGIELKYNMTTRNLYITIRFKHFTGVQQYQPYVEARGMLADAELDDLWPLHYDIVLDGCSIRSYNIRNRLVRHQIIKVLH